MARRNAAVVCWYNRAFSTPAEGVEAPTLVQLDVPIQDLLRTRGFEDCPAGDIHIGPTLRREFLGSVVIGVRFPQTSSPLPAIW